MQQQIYSPRFSALSSKASICNGSLLPFKPLKHSRSICSPCALLTESSDEDMKAPQLIKSSNRYPVLPPHIPTAPFFVYQITHKQNGKFYIGHTSNLDSRVRSHWNSPNRKMKRDIKVAKIADQFFINIFEVTILATAVSRQQAEYIERELSEKLGSSRDGNYGTYAGNPNHYDHLYIWKNAEARRKLQVKRSSL